MREFLRQFAAEWSGDRNQRTKLQRAYITVAVLLSAVAGMFVLVNADVSRVLMFAAVGLAGVHIANAVMWLLLDSIVSPKLPKPKAKSARASRQK